MTTASARRVVVTGLGTTSPLGGDVPSTWTAALAGTSGARTLEHDWVAEYDLPVTFAASLATPTAEVLSRGQVQRLDPSGQMALVAAREAWADAGTPEVDGDRLGVVDRLGDRRGVDPPVVLRRAQGEGPAAGLPADRPDADAERAGRRGQPGGRRARRGAHPGLRLRLGRGVGRLRPRHDPQRPGRHGPRRGDRGGDPPAAHLRVRGDEGVVDPQRRTPDRLTPLRHRTRRLRARRGRRHPRPGGRGARAGPRRHDLRRGRRCRADLRRPPHLRARPRGHGRGPRDDGRPGRPPVPRRATCGTSTPTPRRPRSGTSPRPPPSCACSARPPTGSRCRRPSR